MESRPEYRVAAAGLDPRDVRLIEIVFKHSQYNRYAFRFEAKPDPLAVDILIVNPLSPEGLRAVARARSAGRSLPVISAMPHGATSSGRYAISIDRLTLQLLPILNRVVERELRRPKGDDDAAAASGEGAGSGASPADASYAAAVASGSFESRRRDGDGSRVPAAPAPQPTREFLRAAARVSREGDSAREAAMMRARQAGGVPAAGARVGAPHAPAASAPDAAPSVAAPSPAAHPPSRVPAQAGWTAGSAQRTEAASGAAPSNLVAFPRSAEPPAPRIRVLVVDDSPTVRQQLSIAFARMSVLCDAVGSAEDALARLSAEHYDLVLVDVVMPGVDGYKLTRQIRRRHRGVPVIILTSRSSPFDLARGALAGCNSYLVKPVPLRQLEAAVVKQLRRSLAIDDLTGLLRLTPDPQALAAARVEKPAGAHASDEPGPMPSSGGAGR